VMVIDSPPSEALTSLTFRSLLVKSALHYCARVCWIGDGHGRTEESPALIDRVFADNANAVR
jgi:hypothetical protein